MSFVIFTISWLVVIFSQAFSGETEFKVIIPRGEIPSWFNHRTANHSMSFEVHSSVIEKLLGLGTSVLFCLEDSVSVTLKCDLSLNGELVESLASYLEGSLESSHLWLGYFPLSRNLEEIQDGWNRLEISVEFLDDDNRKSERVKLKGLGAQFVGKTDDREMNKCPWIRLVCPKTESSGDFQEEPDNTSADLMEDVLSTRKCWHDEEFHDLEGGCQSGTNAVNDLPQNQKKPRCQRRRKHRNRSWMGLGLKLTSLKVSLRKTRKRKMN